MANVSCPLEEAAIWGDINRLYAVIEVDPYILEHFDVIPFVDTPLHVAASYGHLHFAIEIMRLKPSFALKLNPQGFSAIHLALQNGHNNLVGRFVEMNKELVRVKGREGITPLHIVSETGEVDLVAKFLEFCPDSIEDVTVRSETALHIAVKNKQLEALRVLVGWLQRRAEPLERSILNWKDDTGITVLHLSALNDDIQALDLLISTGVINVNAKNTENSTALDRAASSNIERKLLKAGAQSGSSVEDDSIPTLAEKLRPKNTLVQRIITNIKRFRGNISDKKRDAYLVVAALILAGIYQSALSPPGGVYQAENGNNSTTLAENAGKSILPRVHFCFLLFINGVVLLATTFTILILIPSGLVGIQLSVSTFFFAFSYLYSMWLVSPTPGFRTMCAFMIGLFAVMSCGVYLELVIPRLKSFRRKESYGGLIYKYKLGLPSNS